jgi:hypothetical protein
MEQSKRQAGKATIISALLLACNHTRLREIVGEDALRSVLVVQFRDLFRHGVFLLQPVWDLLHGQPGFDDGAARAAFCRFKLWEDKLAIAVRLPDDFGDLGAAACTAAAAECQVPPAALNKILGEDPALAASVSVPVPKSRKPTTAIPTAIDGASQLSTRVVAAPARRSQLIQVAAAVVALLAFGYTSVSLYRGCGAGVQWQAVPLAAVREHVPLERAERIGDQVRGVLADPAWLSRSREVREAELGAALRALAGSGVTVLFIQDHGGAIRAVAQLGRGGDAIQYRFP